MEDTLKIIQGLAKAGKIISKIAYVCCMVGFLICAVSMASFKVLGTETFKWGGVTFHALIEQNSDFNMAGIYAVLTVGMILCLAQMVLSKMAQFYFIHELQAGTPFTLEGAKELFRLGVKNIVISLLAVVLSEVAVQVFARVMDAEEAFAFADFNTVGLGLGFMFLSLIFKYGAEIRMQKQ